MLLDFSPKIDPEEGVARFLEFLAEEKSP